MRIPYLARRTVSDAMFFQCEKCLKVFELNDEHPEIPDACPNCSAKCTFTDVTDYTKTPNAIDMNLVRK
ncbi:MAG: hypothetical protein Q6353_006925 [Candidatus Sigynarchaeum springense]